MRRRFTLLALLLAILVIVSSRASADETHASGASPAPSPPPPVSHNFTILKNLSIAHRAPPPSLAPGSDDADDASSSRDEIGDGACAMVESEATKSRARKSLYAQHRTKGYFNLTPIV